MNADPFFRPDLPVVIATIKRELENQITGTQTMLGNGDKPSDRDVTDGTSNTILAVEAQRDVPLTKPEDIPFDSKEQSRYNFPVFLRYDNRHLALGSASRRAL